MVESTTLRRFAALIALLAAPATSATAQTFPGPDANLVDRVVAVVGDSTILMSQVEEVIVRLQLSDSTIPVDTDPEYDAFFRDVLESAVDQLLVLQAAAKDTLIQPDEAAIDRQVQDRLDQLALQVGGQPALQIALQRDGWTLGEYREFLRADVRKNQIFQMFLQGQLAEARPVEVTEEELRQRFQQLSPQLQQRPRLLTFRQVVVAPEANDSAKAVARAEAEALVDSVVAGRDFAELATAYSDDVGTASVGGDLGWFRRGQMVREFEEVAFAVPAGRVSRVVETVFGYHIIKVERVRGRSEIQARHILKMPEISPEDVQRARDLASEIAGRAQAGESMTALYDEYSDPLAPDSLTIAFDQLSQLPPVYSALRGAVGGAIIGPLEYQAGSGAPGDVRFAIVKVITVREAGAYTLDDLRAQLADQIRQERQQERILQDLRAQTYIDIRM